MRAGVSVGQSGAGHHHAVGGGRRAHRWCRRVARHPLDRCARRRGVCGVGGQLLHRVEQRHRNRSVRRDAAGERAAADGGRTRRPCGYRRNTASATAWCHGVHRRTGDPAASQRMGGAAGGSGVCLARRVAWRRGASRRGAERCIDWHPSRWKGTRHVGTAGAARRVRGDGDAPDGDARPGAQLGQSGHARRDARGAAPRAISGGRPVAPAGTALAAVRQPVAMGRLAGGLRVAAPSGPVAGADRTDRAVRVAGGAGRAPFMAARGARGACDGAAGAVGVVRRGGVAQHARRAHLRRRFRFRQCHP